MLLHPQLSVCGEPASEVLFRVLPWLPLRRDESEAADLYGTLSDLVERDEAYLRSAEMLPLLLGAMLRTVTPTLMSYKVVATPPANRDRLVCAFLPFAHSTHIAVSTRYPLLRLYHAALLS